VESCPPPPDATGAVPMMLGSGSWWRMAEKAEAGSGCGLAGGPVGAKGVWGGGDGSPWCSAPGLHVTSPWPKAAPVCGQSVKRR
jgi:hypothetical protein